MMAAYEETADVRVAANDTDADSDANPLGGIVYNTAAVFAPRPEPQWMIPALQFCPGRPALIVAKPGIGKTMILQALAAALLSGRPIWGSFQHNGPMRVAHVDYDQGVEATRMRYARFFLGSGITEADVGGRLLVIGSPAVRLNSPGAAQAFTTLARRTDLVIIDSLRSATPDDDENSSGMARRLGILLEASEKTGACFVVVHHANKGGEPRGSNAIEAAAGAVYELDERGPHLRLRHTRAAALARGALREPILLAIEDVPIGDDPEAGVRVVARQDEQVEPAASLADDERARESVLAYVRANPGQNVGTVRKCAVGSNTARGAAMKYLKENGEIVYRKDGRSDLVFLAEAGNA